MVQRLYNVQETPTCTATICTRYTEDMQTYNEESNAHPRDQTECLHFQVSQITHIITSFLDLKHVSQNKNCRT